MENDVFNSTALIADIFERWPEAVRLFVAYRMYCPGCDLTSYETLEDAMRVYGIPRIAFVQELNIIIQNEDSA